MTFQTPDIAVVGSCNVDVLNRVDRLPAPGETVLSTGYQRLLGGKGANQATAAAKLGSHVSMIARVGDDEDGVFVRQTLERAEVDCVGLAVSREPTGIAHVVVDNAGENAIVVTQGANAGLSADDVQRCEKTLRTARVCLLQLEVPDAAVLAAARLCDGTVVLNPAPARRLSPELWNLVDVLVPNRSELAFLTGSPEALTVEEAASQAISLDFSGTIVVTLGADGALVVRQREVTHVPAPAVHPIDTTGAGDAFCGALADLLARGADIIAAVERAVIAAALSTLAVGAQAGQASVAALETFQASRSQQLAT